MEVLIPCTWLDTESGCVPTATGSVCGCSQWKKDNFEGKEMNVSCIYEIYNPG